MGEIIHPWKNYSIYLTELVSFLSKSLSAVSSYFFSNHFEIYCRPGNFSSLGKQTMFFGIMTLQKQWKEFFVSVTPRLQ